MTDHPLFLTVVALAGMLLPLVPWIAGELWCRLARERTGEE
jgi:hypothetical protein